MSERDIVLTGIPRSGTTLACWLLNQLPDVVALVEPPMGVRFWLGRWDRRLARSGLRRFFIKVRERLAAGRPVPSLHIDGEIPANPVEEQRVGPLRRHVARYGKVHVAKRLSMRFWLIVKHPGPFTVLLSELIHHFSVYAVVRNPLAVLASWNSVSLSLNKGRVPVGEWLYPSLRRTLSRIGDRWERQLYLLDWFFETYRRVLPETVILRYEDIIATGGRALSVIVPEAAELTVSLRSRNASSLYDASLMRALGERLLKSDGAFWDFYSRESVEQLLAEVGQ
ncbi:MAG TPA: hypothetical protein VNM72_07650 [Blastocatellia bacterium]|nr:hypothetical protein [Blastocatellia bacterium]